MFLFLSSRNFYSFLKCNQSLPLPCRQEGLPPLPTVIEGFCLNGEKKTGKSIKPCVHPLTASHYFLTPALVRWLSDLLPCPQSFCEYPVEGHEKKLEGESNFPSFWGGSTILHWCISPHVSLIFFLMLAPFFSHPFMWWPQVFPTLPWVKKFISSISFWKNMPLFGIQITQLLCDLSSLKCSRKVMIL